MSKGEIPTQYIVALILGVVVIGVLVYWFLSQQGRTVSAVDEIECRARKLAYCLEVGVRKPEWTESNARVCGGTTEDTVKSECSSLTSKPPTPTKKNGDTCDPNKPNSDGCPGKCLPDKKQCG